MRQLNFNPLALEICYKAGVNTETADKINMITRITTGSVLGYFSLAIALIAQASWNAIYDNTVKSAILADINEVRKENLREKLMNTEDKIFDDAFKYIEKVDDDIEMRRNH